MFLRLIRVLDGNCLIFGYEKTPPLVPTIVGAIVALKISAICIAMLAQDETSCLLT
jgi:hypothetical protein